MTKDGTGVPSPGIGHDGASRSEHHLRLRVIERDVRVPGVVVLTLGIADGTALPDWEPGAHLDLRLLDGRYRSYSLCGRPGAHVWRIAVRRSTEPGSATDWIHDVIAVGDVVLVRPPRNHFRLESAATYLFIAGGIGITPLLPMLAAAETAGAEWRLAYVGRGRDRMAFVGELGDYGGRVRLFDSAAGERLDLAALAAEHGDAGLIYCCGPDSLLTAARSRWGEHDGSPLRTEEFRAARPSASPGTFEVELNSTGVTVEVPPDRSILDVAEDAGAFALSSCREGTCGTCETVVLAGVVEHRDRVLTPSERARGDRMMICVSRAASGSRLVLDL